MGTESREAKKGTQVMSKSINVHPAAKSAQHYAKLLIVPLPNECARHNKYDNYHTNSDDLGLAK